MVYGAFMEHTITKRKAAYYLRVYSRDIYAVSRLFGPCRKLAETRKFRSLAAARKAFASTKACGIKCTLGLVEDFVFPAFFIEEDYNPEPKPDAPSARRAWLAEWLAYGQSHGLPVRT